MTIEPTCVGRSGHEVRGRRALGSEGLARVQRRPRVQRTPPPGRRSAATAGRGDGAAVAAERLVERRGELVDLRGRRIARRGEVDDDLAHAHLQEGRTAVVDRAVGLLAQVVTIGDRLAGSPRRRARDRVTPSSAPARKQVTVA